MSTRRFLILVPLVLSLLLLQSYFWVPTYDEQARGNPGRLEEYINASIGDASILNPILSADSASSEIDNQVFEGLIDRDENLRFRGRVAQSWEVTEEAFFFVNDAARVPGAQGQPHTIIRQAGHFLQEDKGPDVAQAISSFIRATPRGQGTNGLVS